MRENLCFSQNSVTTKSYPRAALIGNPSDGYNGKTIAFLFSNFSVTATIEESDEIRILIPEEESPNYKNIHSFYQNISQYGYYGGVRLVKAAIKVFYDHCNDKNYPLRDQNFTINYQTDIPRSLGMAGSSAIVTAVIKALMQFYYINIPKEELANIILSAEKQELGIAAGLQDRVAQACSVPVYMDFDREYMKNHGYGKYQVFDSSLLPQLYIAYKLNNSESSGKVHSDLQARFDRGNEAVQLCINRLSEITDKMYESLVSKNHVDAHQLINENFNIRKKMMPISDANQELINRARECGVSAKFTGSGGAIIGTWESAESLEKLKLALKKVGATVILPQIVKE